MAVIDFDQPGVEPRVVFPGNIDRRLIVMEPECSCPGVGQHLKRYTGEEASRPIGGDWVVTYSTTGYDVIKILPKSRYDLKFSQSSPESFGCFFSDQ
jgi:hypothetical protein